VILHNKLLLEIKNKIDPLHKIDFKITKNSHNYFLQQLPSKYDKNQKLKLNKKKKKPKNFGSKNISTHLKQKLINDNQKFIH
jgi:hypothetical protein